MPSSTAVLSHLRAELREGRHAPGEALSISLLAARLGFSPTPVREALAHLAGEGLVSERRGQGYFVAPLDAEALAGRYRLQQLYLGAALQAPARAWAVAPAAPLRLDDPPAATEALFAAIVAVAGDHALTDAHRRLADRLAAARRAELRVLGDGRTELADLRARWMRGDRPALAAALAAYHQRRQAAAADLAALLQAGELGANI